MPPFPCRKPTAGPVRTSGITDRCSPLWGFPFPLSAWQAVQTACAPFPRCTERRFPTGKVFQRETEKSSSFPERPGTAICCGRNAFSAKTPDSPRKAHETGLHAAQNRDDRRAESLSADRPGFTPEADKNVPRGVPRFSPGEPCGGEKRRSGTGGDGRPLALSYTGRASGHRQQTFHPGHSERDTQDSYRHPDLTLTDSGGPVLSFRAWNLRLSRGMTEKIIFFPFFLLTVPAESPINPFTPRGSNSVVECNLAKVEVAGSNPVSRSSTNFVAT